MTTRASDTPTRPDIAKMLGDPQLAKNISRRHMLIEEDVIRVLNSYHLHAAIAAAVAQVVPFATVLAALAAAPGYWYLASPYSKYPDGTELAFAAACGAAAKLMDAGVRIFCPIAHTHPIAKHTVSEDTHDFWLGHDKPLLDAAYGLLVLRMPGWQESYGVQWEITRAIAHQKIVRYLDWPLKISGLNK